MSITIYTKPNHKGESVNFDPNTVKSVFLVSEYSDGLGVYKKTFGFVNKDGFSSIDEKHERFRIGSIRSNNRNFFLVAFSAPATNKASGQTTISNIKIIEGSVTDTNDNTRYSGVLVMKYPEGFYVHFVVCIIIIVLLVAYVVYLRLMNQ